MFNLDPETLRLWDSDDDVQTAISYEFTNTLNLVNRKVFSIMDLLSALGGLAGALVGVFTLGVVVFQYKATINYMANNTYLFKSLRDEKSK